MHNDKKAAPELGHVVFCFLLFARGIALVFVQHIACLIVEDTRFVLLCMYIVS